MMTHDKNPMQYAKGNKPKTKKKQIVDPRVDAPILNADGTHASQEAKFDTGMRVKEAVQQAAFWWNNKGRTYIKDKNLASDNPGFKAFNPDPKSIEEADNWVPSGVLAGKAWDDLSKTEKIAVTKHWHHNHVRVPNIDPELYLRCMKQEGKCFYCDEDTAADETLPNGEQRELCWSHFMHRYPEEAKAVFTEKEGHNDNDAEKS